MSSYGYFNANVLVSFRLTTRLPIDHRALNERPCRLFAHNLSNAHGAHLYLNTGGKGDWYLGNFGDMATLENAVYRTGITFQENDRGAKFFSALVREGKAELLVGEHCAINLRPQRHAIGQTK